MPDGKFHPDGKLTPAQAVAFLMKFLGVKPDTTQAWPSNYLDKAVELGIITAEDKQTIDPSANSAASRGLIFYLYDRTFYNYELPSGKTLYTTYVDNAPPTLKVNPIGAAETSEKSVAISGTVSGANYIMINNQTIDVADGPFSGTVDLAVGTNTITVTALDTAGNTASYTLTIKRKPGAPAAIAAEAVTVAAGESVKITAAVTDADGNPIDDETITGVSDAGTYADGTFKAGTKAGKGKLTRTVDVTVTPAALHKLAAQKSSVKVNESTVITGFDVYGNTITNITFSVNGTNASIGAATGAFSAQKSGKYTVTGKAGDVTVALEIEVFSAADRVTEPAATVPVFSGVPGQETTVTVDTYGLPSPSEQPVSLQITAVSNRTVTYSASGLPPGLTINPSTGTIAGTVNTSAIDAGFHVWVDFDVVVTAMNTAGQKAALSFVWKVKMDAPDEEPTPPVFVEVIAHQDTTVYFDENLKPLPGDPVSLQASASSNRPIAYTADRLPPGVSIHSETGAITGAIDTAELNAQPGAKLEFPVTVTATNSAGQREQFQFTWFITVRNAGE